MLGKQTSVYSSSTTKRIPITPIAIPVKEKLFARKSTYMLIPCDRGTEKGMLEYSRRSYEIQKCFEISDVRVGVLWSLPCSDK